MTGRKIRVFVVDDSAVARELLLFILRSDPEIEVVGSAGDGETAIASIASTRPDLITMDIHMPGMDGYQTARRIMETLPAPIVIVTASENAAKAGNAFRVLEAGAVAIIEKPRGIGHPGYDAMAANLVLTVKLMSEVKVVKRWIRAAALPLPVPADPGIKASGKTVDMVAIGASTGGPPVLHAILSRLSADFSAPILIVQHISAGFVESLAGWLANVTGLPVHVAIQGERLRPGHVYLAPDGAHMTVNRVRRIVLTADLPGNGLCPSVARLFGSVAEVCRANGVGILLTGMGRDGADELKIMRDLGATTIAQDRESCVVFGMPGEAVKLGAAGHILSPAQIAAVLETLLQK